MNLLASRDPNLGSGMSDSRLAVIFPIGDQNSGQGFRNGLRA
jgi:hypothetical protein